jgi:hypothetical protein
MEDGAWSRGDTHRRSFGSDSDEDNDDVGSDDDTFADEGISGDERVEGDGAQSERKSKKKKKKKSRSSSKSKSSSSKKKKKKKKKKTTDETEESDKVKTKSTKKKKKSKDAVANDEPQDGEVECEEKPKSTKKKKKKKPKSDLEAGEESDKVKKKKKRSTSDSPKKMKKEKEKSKSKKPKSKTSVEETTETTDTTTDEQLHFVEDPSEENAADDNSEAERMKNMLAQWGDSDDDDSSSDSSDNSGDEPGDDEGEVSPNDQQKSKYDLGLRDNEIDHIILAAPDYEEAVKEFETMTGIKPARLGGLKGLGIRAARVATDNNCYIEILAPDPSKPGPIGAKLSQLEEGTLIPYHYAIRQSELDELQQEFVPNELGYVPDRINLFSPAPDGAPAKWGMLFMHGHFIGGVVPYYVDWGKCAHPISSIPTVGPLKSLTVTAPGGSQVHNILKDVGLVTTMEGDPAIEFCIGTPEGTITFSGESPEGLVFPGTFHVMDINLIVLCVKGSYRVVSSFSFRCRGAGKATARSYQAGPDAYIVSTLTDHAI